MASAGQAAEQLREAFLAAFSAYASANAQLSAAVADGAAATPDAGSQDIDSPAGLPSKTETDGKAGDHRRDDMSSEAKLLVLLSNTAYIREHLVPTLASKYDPHRLSPTIHYNANCNAPTMYHNANCNVNRNAAVSMLRQA